MMNRKNDAELLAVLELIDNDLETLALAFIATVPPLIHMAFGPDRQEIAESLSEDIIKLADTHASAAGEIRARLKETLRSV